MTLWKTLCPALVSLGMMTCASLPVSAYTIDAPGSTVEGSPIVDWTAAWWTWALQAPFATNPLRRRGPQSDQGRGLLADD